MNGGHVVLCTWRSSWRSVVQLPFLHSLLMSAIVVSDKFADAILVFCLRGDSLRTCVAVQRLQVRLLGRLLSLLISGTFNLLLTNLCPDAPCYVCRFLSESEHRVSE